VIESFSWLSDADKLKIFHHNPLRVFPALKVP
jgi:hypothetical protein